MFTHTYNTYKKQLAPKYDFKLYIILSYYIDRYLYYTSSQLSTIYMYYLSSFEVINSQII